MKDLNDIDPLPKIADAIGQLPAKRHWDEAFKEDAKNSGEDWRKDKEAIYPTTQFNGKGQFRTVDYKPPEPPETDIPVGIVSGFGPMLVTTDTLTFPATGSIQFYEGTDFLSQAESQPQAASQMEQEKLWTPNLADYWQPGADGWIPHTPGDPMPCDPNMLVDVRFDDGGESGEAQQASFWAEGREDNWRGRLDTGEPLESDQITAWRPA
jgi:hypothetical protein